MPHTLVSTLVCVLAVAACSKHEAASPECEKARDKFLSNYAQKITEVLAQDDDAHRARDKKDSEDEVAAAKVKFVPLCKATKDFKFDCFDSVEKEDSADCKAFTRDFSHRALSSVP